MAAGSLARREVLAGELRYIGDKISKGRRRIRDVAKIVRSCQAGVLMGLWSSNDVGI